MNQQTKKHCSEGCSAEMNNTAYQTTMHFTKHCTVSTFQHLSHYKIEISLYSKYPLLLLFLPNTDHPFQQIKNYVRGHSITKCLTCDHYRCSLL